MMNVAYRIRMGIIRFKCHIIMLSGGSAVWKRVIPACRQRERSIRAYQHWCNETLQLRRDTAAASFRVTRFVAAIRLRLRSG